MRIRDLFREAATALSINRMRSLLTILGIVIGISSVIAMTSMVGGLSASLSGSLGGNQARMIQISTMVDADKADYEALAARSPELESVVLMSGSPATLANGAQTYQPPSGVSGVQAGFADAMDLKMASGKFFTEADDTRANRVVVLGGGIVKELFGSENAQVVGTTISIGDDAYTVVGVLEGATGTSYYANVFIPLTTMETRLGGSGTYSAFALAAGTPDAARMDAIAKKTTATFASILGTDNSDKDITVYVMSQVLEELNMVMGVLGLILGGVAAISLLVGGVGIMNMMLTNVTERIREIGLRKALGAHRRDIVSQFLLESVLLTLVGGIIGMVFGLLGGMLIAAIISMVQPEMAFSAALDLNSVLLAVGVSAAIGVIFGFYPARRAAKLDPIEALRYQ